jgi:hypothetical protein
MDIDVVYSDYVDDRATQQGMFDVAELTPRWMTESSEYYGDQSGPFKPREHKNNYRDPAFFKQHPALGEMIAKMKSGYEELIKSDPYVPSYQEVYDGLMKFDLLCPGMAGLLEYSPRGAIWLRYMPTALALYTLTHQGWIRPGVKDDEATRLLFDNMEVARGIRARIDWLERTMREVAKQKTGGDRARITSLACGEADRELHFMRRSRSIMTLLDIDPDALYAASKRQYTQFFGEEAMVASRNILAKNGIDAFSAKVLGAILARTKPQLMDFSSIGKGSQDLVAAIGLAEYLPLENWRKAIFPMAGLRQFLHNAYELVAPGGKLLVGFMLYGKWGVEETLNPHILFLTDVLQWGRLKPRVIGEVVAAFIESGVNKRSIENIKVAIMPEGLYALLEVTKAR